MSEHAEPHSLVGAQVGKYRVEALLGRGGMGEVYRAHDDQLDRDVAIKRPLAQFTDLGDSGEQLLLEARKAIRVGHHHIATVHDVIQHEGLPLIVMEYVDGRKLGDVIRAGTFDEQRALDLARQTAEALQAIHAAGLVHRDLKPSNLMVTPSGDIKVLDFGLAAQSAPVVEEILDSNELTVSVGTDPARHSGTLPYMSPEQLLGDRLDHRSDFFSLGIVLFQALTGKHPFHKATLAAVASSILHDPPGDDPTSMQSIRSPRMRRLIERLLEKRREDRYRDAGELLADIERIDQGRAIRRAPTRRRQLLRRGAVAAVVVAGLGLLTWAWKESRGPGPGPLPGRPIVAVHPLVDHTGEANSKASMIAGLIEARLSESTEARPISHRRFTELLAADDVPNPRALAAGIGATWLLRGELYRENGYVGTFDLDDLGDPDGADATPGQSFSVTHATATGLAAETSRKVRELVAGRPLLPVDTYLASSSDEAQALFERAEQARRDLDYRSADDLLQGALQIDENFLGARLLRARVLERMGMRTTASTEAQQADRMARSAGVPHDSRTGLLVAGLVADLADQHATAADTYSRILERYPDDTEVALLLGDIEVSARTPESALATMDAALTYDRLDPAIHLARANALVRLERFDEAGAAIDEAERLVRSFNVRGGLGRIAMARGYHAFRRSAWDEAAGHYHAALGNYEQYGMATEMAIARKSLMDVDVSQFRLDQAIERLNEILPEFERAGHLGFIASAQISLGSAYYRAADYPRAIVTLDRAIAMTRRLEQHELEHSALIALSGSLLATDRRDEAEAAIRRSLEMARVLDQPFRRHHSMMKLAEWYRLTGDPKGARSALETVIAEATNPRLRLSAHQDLALLGLDYEQFEPARPHADRALELAAERNSARSLAFTTYLHATVMARLGELDAAQRDLEGAGAIPAAGNSAALDKMRRIATWHVHAARREWEAAVQAVDAVDENSPKELRVLRALALVALERPAEVAELLGAAFDANAWPAALAAPAGLALAQAHQQSGRTEQARRVATEAHELAQRHGQNETAREIESLLGKLK